MAVLNIIAQILVIIGALNWGLVGLINLNVVEAIFGAGTPITTIIYIIVGIAGLYSIYLIKPVMDGSRQPKGKEATKQT